MERTANDIRAVFATCPDDVVLAVTQKTNCAEADVALDGEVWIADPMTGHWLQDSDLVELAEWIERETGQPLEQWAGAEPCPADVPPSATETPTGPVLYTAEELRYAIELVLSGDRYAILGRDVRRDLVREILEATAE